MSPDSWLFIVLYAYTKWMIKLGSIRKISIDLLFLSCVFFVARLDG